MRFIGSGRGHDVFAQDIIHGFVELYSERHPSRIWVCLEKCWWLQVPLWPDCLHVARVLELLWKLWTNHCDIAVSLETLCPLCCYMPGSEDERCCQICLEDFSEKEQLRKLHCGPDWHVFISQPSWHALPFFFVKSWIWITCKSCHQVFPGTGQARDIFQDRMRFHILHGQRLSRVGAMEAHYVANFLFHKTWRMKMVLWLNKFQLQLEKHAQMVDQSESSIINIQLPTWTHQHLMASNGWPGHSFHAKCVDEWLTEKSRSCSSVTGPYQWVQG